LVSKPKIAKDLGDRIREIRIKKGISLRDFEAYESGFEKSSLSKIEKGIHVPTVFTLYRIAEVLDVDVAEFFKK
jgi:transcriptional regulator with XRE-family HTH domain